MCGIVGLFLKDASLEPKLGELLSAMMITMSDRGPDSAGIALYGNKQPNLLKLTLQSPTPDQDFDGLDHLVSKRTRSEVTMKRNSEQFSRPHMPSDVELSAHEGFLEKIKGPFWKH